MVKEGASKVGFAIRTSGKIHFSLEYAKGRELDAES